MSVIINPGGSGGAINSYPVGGLPPSGPIGTMAYVTDGSAGLPWAATVTGGGHTRYLVWFNGANWTVVGDGGYTPPSGAVPTYPYYGF
jgi:hypothetical protein